MDCKGFIVYIIMIQSEITNESEAKSGSNSCCTFTVNHEKNWILNTSRIIIMIEIVKCERKKY